MRKEDKDLRRDRVVLVICLLTILAAMVGVAGVLPD